jgi:hypothetical protein
LELEEILRSFGSKKITISQAQKLLSLYSIEKIENFAQIDLGRKKRRGIPEVVFAEQKQFREIKLIVQKVLKKSNSVLVSRLNKSDYKNLLKFVNKAKLKTRTGKNSTSILIHKKKLKFDKGKIGILTAGTSDIGVAEEARLMCEAMNCKCFCSYDVGIAGIHRVFPILKQFVQNDVDVVIVVAGMEGALASLVSASTDLPVIGVPTSVGYGYGQKGVAALASMLQSCTLGLSTVNIDNGIGGGAVAANIANRMHRKKI